MKKIIILSIAIVVAGLYSLQSNKIVEDNKGINFNSGTWKEVTQNAEKEKKIIFLDIYASWCGPCKRLKKSTFSDENVGSLFNGKFTNAAFDAEKGEGIALAKKYEIRSYPTLLFLNADGSVIKKVIGYHTSDELLALAAEILKK